MTQGRIEGGKFAPKSDEPRQVRSIRVTDKAWERLGQVAELRRITRADLIEELVESGTLEQNQSAISGDLKAQVRAAAEMVLQDETVTRKGKDRGSVKRALEALINLL